MRVPLVFAMLCSMLPSQTQLERDALKSNFARMDRDDDGVLQRGEFPGSDRQFTAMDRDRNKKISLEEYLDSEVGRRFLAATYRNSLEPRSRTTAEQLQSRRLMWISRFDGNRDGVLTREEWTGSPLAFISLDADGNGVIDSSDRTEAEGSRWRGEPTLPRLTSRLPEPDYLVQRLDRNRDEMLSRREVGSDALAAVFEFADRDGDGLLTMAELRAVVRQVAQMVAERNRGSAQPRAYTVPFSAWDTNDNGRLEQSEWLQRRNLFPRIDQNRDAAVTPDEIERYKRSVEGITFFERFDLNNDNRVTLEEFGGSPDAFRRADRNGDGVISRRDR